MKRSSAVLLLLTLLIKASIVVAEINYVNESNIAETENKPDSAATINPHRSEQRIEQKIEQKSDALSQDPEFVRDQQKTTQTRQIPTEQLPASEPSQGKSAATKDETNSNAADPTISNLREDVKNTEVNGSEIPTRETVQMDSTATVDTDSHASPDPTISAPKSPAKRQMIPSGNLLQQGMPALPSVPQLPVSRYASSPDKNFSFEPGEVLLVNIAMPEALSAAQQLSRFGLKIKSRNELKPLGLVLTVFRLSKASETRKVLAQIAKKYPALLISLNHRYALLADPKNYAKHLISWPQTVSVTCKKTSAMRIGMLDTAVNLEHPALQQQNIIAKSFIFGHPAPATHGTAVASLLVGDPASKMHGLLPDASLFAANVFHRRGDKTETTTESLLNALNWLLQNKVSVINVSLGGPENRILHSVLTKVVKQGTHVVAAAGNNGPQASPIFPAAIEGVTAVTAVDAALRLYPQANRGAYIDFAAPGVNVWAANEGAGQFHTGTSFAVPFVTALFAIADSKTLQQQVKDLGAKGKDEEFGWGLISAKGLCL